ncbi:MULTISPECIES: hypothetical protein [Stenotrophomonas]|uniref:Fimbrial protein n=1 Tax=Stenotrophomonas rhizophila TaxID=216778 RepID=A0A498CE01_9GAMM|nr:MULTISPECIES: hypothetical protein [Stenotrophomonas]KAB7628585.1 hypothetical protein F9K92_16920 [Stenotrophomonas rhizophila]RLK56016.1 hypothetical protein BCL79_0388 [Stenotrophomonas rhizophila]
MASLHPLLLLGLVLPGAALAQAGGTASFAMGGQIEAGTCAVGSVARTLPEVTANVFPQSAEGTAGVPSSYTAFALSLTRCAGVLGAEFVMGTPADGEPTHSNLFRNKAADAAPFAAIWLKAGTCASSSTITPGAPFSRDFSTPEYELLLCAQYAKYRGGLVTQGGISTDFTVTITYR